jgi:NAD+ synthase (glutamine-hydrolysing)
MLPITEMFDAGTETLKNLFAETQFGIAEENMQARIRGLLLMSYSNKFGDILLNTSNKSEMSVGYSTLYGDMCGSLSPIGDVYKSKVYSLARFINRQEEVIPGNILTKAPSAELRPGQKDSDSLPDYPVLDEILRFYIDERKGRDEIITHGYDPNTVDKILKLVNNSEYKRFQAPPILRVSGKAFGRGRNMPLVAWYG